MPTTRVLRGSHSHSPLSTHRLDDCLSDTRTFNLPPLKPKRTISKELILLKKQPSLIVRKMLSLNIVTYRRAPKNVTSINPQSDDVATLVTGLHPPPPYETTFTKETNVEQLPSAMLGKKICQYLPSCSGENKEDNDSSAQQQITSTSTSSSRDEFSRNEIFDDSLSFEIVKEDDRIVYATALGPPPWHRPKESILVYQPADLLTDEVQCPASGEPNIRDFAW